jgi:hypothetical protein
MTGGLEGTAGTLNNVGNSFFWQPVTVSELIFNMEEPRRKREPRGFEATHRALITAIRREANDFPRLCIEFDEHFNFCGVSAVSLSVAD